VTDGVGEGFARASTGTLLAIRANLLKGLDQVVNHLDAGTLHVVDHKRSSSPAEAGRVTLGLLDQVDKELKNREGQTH
jgi:hypothetical protein